MNELVGYGVAAMTFVALGHSLERGTLIRMNLLLLALGPRSAIRRALEILSVLFALSAAGIALRYFVLSAVRNYERGYTSETAAEIPLWLPEAFVVAGLSVFLLQLLSYLLRLVAGGPMIDEAGEGAAPPEPRV